MKKRIGELDGLRAIAVASVVVFHVFGEAKLTGGYLGVDIFFVISGYLITVLLLKEQQETGRISLKDFYLRRIRRIWPAFSILLLVVMGVEFTLTFVFGAMPDGSFLLVLFSAASIMNWIRAFDYSGGGILGHVWSLSVEEQFYLVWPVMLMLGLRYFGRRRMLLLIAAGALAAALWRSYLAVHGASPDRTYNGLDTRADSLLIGCLLGVYGIDNIPQGIRDIGVALASAILLAMLATASWTSTFMNTGGFTIASLCAAFWVAETVRPHGIVTRVLGSAPAVWLGLRSYSLYLWHYPVMTWMIMANVPPAAGGPLTLLLSILLADLSYRFVEKPFLHGATAAGARTKTA